MRRRGHTIRALVRLILEQGGRRDLDSLVAAVAREFPHACGGHTYVGAIRRQWLRERGQP